MNTSWLWLNERPTAIRISETTIKANYNKIHIYQKSRGIYKGGKDVFCMVVFLFVVLYSPLTYACYLFHTTDPCITYFWPLLSVNSEPFTVYTVRCVSYGWRLHCAHGAVYYNFLISNMYMDMYVNSIDSPVWFCLSRSAYYSWGYSVL